jgi:hypothetical protein
MLARMMLRVRANTLRTSMLRFLAEFLGVMRPDSTVAMRIVTVDFRYCWQLTRKLQVFAVFEFFFALLAVFFFGALPFEQLFFGHLVIVAGCEHGTAPAALRGA